MDGYEKIKIEYDAYMAVVEKALQANPQDIQALMHKAVMLFDFYKDSKGAESLFAKILEIDSSNVDTYMWLGEYWQFHRANYELALQSLSKALELDPNRADCYAILAAVLEFAGRPVEQVEACYYKSFELDPSYINPRWYLVISLFERGEFAKARKEAEEALKVIESSSISSSNPVQEYYESMITGRDYPEIKQHLLDLLEKINHAEKTANGNA